MTNRPFDRVSMESVLTPEEIEERDARADYWLESQELLRKQEADIARLKERVEELERLLVEERARAHDLTLLGG